MGIKIPNLKMKRKKGKVEKKVTKRRKSPGKEVLIKEKR